MKQHEYRARIKATKRKAREEFVLLEEYVNTGQFDPGPFIVYGKKVHYSVGTSDYCPIPVLAANRVRAMSEQFWPKEKYENSVQRPDASGQARFSRGWQDAPEPEETAPNAPESPPEASSTVRRTARRAQNGLAEATERWYLEMRRESTE